MESILLTLDVACMVLLLRNVLRVLKTGRHTDLGYFSYPVDSTEVKPPDAPDGEQPSA